jgi:HSP20 family protein
MLIRRDRMPTLFREQTRSPRYLTNWLDDVVEDMLNDTGSRFFPELNVSETDRDFEVSLELPGMRKEDIEISLDDNVLTVSGERKAHYEGEENGRRYHRVESRFGTFSRTLPLPNIIDRENVSASYDNGVLTITIPKLEEKAGRKIKVS